MYVETPNGDILNLSSITLLRKGDLSLGLEISYNIIVRSNNSVHSISYKKDKKMRDIAFNKIKEALKVSDILLKKKVKSKKWEKTDQKK